MKKFIYNSLKQVSRSVAMTMSTISIVSAQGFTAETELKLQQVIESFQNNPGNRYVGGMSAAIKIDGLAFWQGASGFAARNVDAANNLLPGGTPFTKDMLSRMYSVTKTFTAALVLELAKEGVFGLSEPINRYLPLLNVVNPGLSNTVTIQQLLAHESGFSDYTAEIQLQIAIAFDPSRIWNVYEMASFVHQINTPGNERRYSSTNYVFLGAIIEVATGKPLEQHYRERFFNPLHLSSMYLAGRESIGNRSMLVSPHDNISAFNPIFQLTGQPTFPNEYTNISRFPLDAIVSLAAAGGGIVTNAADLAEWGNALFAGRATSLSTLNVMINSISPTPDSDGDKLGYGIFSNTRLSETDLFLGHDGNAPGYRSVMFYQPDRKMTIVVLTNYYGADPYAVAKALYEALPDFLCGNENKKEDKIVVCFKGNELCISRSAAPELIEKGAFLGRCGLYLSNPGKKPTVLNTISGDRDKLTISPNPAKSTVLVSFQATESGMADVRLYDMNGIPVSILFSGQSEKNVVRQVNFQSLKLPPGTYICRLQTRSGITQQKLIMK